MKISSCVVRAASSVAKSAPSGSRIIAEVARIASRRVVHDSVLLHAAVAPLRAILLPGFRVQQDRLLLAHVQHHDAALDVLHDLVILPAFVHLQDGLQVPDEERARLAVLQLLVNGALASLLDDPPSPDAGLCLRPLREEAVHQLLGNDVRVHLELHVAAAGDDERRHAPHAHHHPIMARRRGPL